MIAELMEFGIRSGVFKDGFLHRVTTGEHISKARRAAGVKMVTEIKHPLGTSMTTLKVDPKRRPYGRRAKPYSEVALIDVPPHYPNQEHLPMQDKKPLRGSIRGGISMKQLSDKMMGHFAKNGTRLKYHAVPLDQTGKGIAEAAVLDRHYKIGAAKHGFTHDPGDGWGMATLIPPKMQRPPKKG